MTSLRQIESNRCNAQISDDHVARKNLIRGKLALHVDVKFELRSAVAERELWHLRDVHC
jgi:hypothetical protein